MPQDHADSTAPSLSRRREIGQASARSLLLTMLGEFALPSGEPVWTATALEALARVGVEERAARQALARTSAEGVLTSQRHGRRTAWQLTPRGVDLLRDGSSRIYGFLKQAHDWDGRWLVLTVSIPETQRRLRHRLRTRLTWLGLGSPSPGLWVTPDAGQAGHVDRVIEELGLTPQSFAWAGPTTGLADQERLVAAAWDLGDVEKRYLEFLERFDGRGADSAGEAFAVQVELVQEWRRFPFLDPDLPRELLDHDWPGPRAAAVFGDRHRRWHRQAQAEWARMQEAASGRS